jgi:hypothetical protein
MKRINFLPAVIALLLMVTAVSCTTMNEGYGEDDHYTTTTTSGNRIYVDDPYQGTIVLERDPYSGRYYQVSPYGYSRTYGGNYGNGRYYGNRRYNNNTYSRGYSRNNTYYNRNNTNNQASQQQQQQQQQENQKQGEEARKRILGKN